MNQKILPRIPDLSINEIKQALNYEEMIQFHLSILSLCNGWKVSTVNDQQITQPEMPQKLQKLLAHSSSILEVPQCWTVVSVHFKICFIGSLRTINPYY